VRRKEDDGNRFLSTFNKLPGKITHQVGFNDAAFPERGADLISLILKSWGKIFCL
jgi:hypothetical protein